MTRETKFFQTQPDKKSSPFLSVDSSAVDEFTSKLVSSHQKAYDAIIKEESKLQTEIQKLKDAGNEEELREKQELFDKIHKSAISAEKKLEAEKMKATDVAIQVAERKAVNSYKRMSISEKAAYQRTLSEKALMEKKRAEEDIELFDQKSKEQEKIAKDLNKAIAKEKAKGENADLEKIKELQDARNDANAKKREYAQKSKDSKNEATALQDTADSATEAATKLSKKRVFGVNKEDQATERLKLKSLAVDRASEKVVLKKLDLDKKQQEFEKKHLKDFQDLEKAKKRGDRDELKRIQARIEAEEEGDADLKKAKDELRKAEKEEEKALAAEKREINKKGLSDALNKAVDAASKAIDGHLNDMFGEQGRMMGRLQGSALDWKDTVDDISDTIGFSGYVSKKNVVAKMVELVDSGVAYNLEMRAFLAETSQNIASTFSATNGTLLRLIRLQQADTTAARLGMEASLTRLFNEMFEDTSYLANDVADTVSGAILDASALMDKNEALEFEYTLQKWLGALYSLGMSDSAISKIAEGINYLGTSNIEALNNDSALTTLLAMSANRSKGSSYEYLVENGLTAKDTNELLKSMVEYLAEIADSETSRVAKSAYANLFDMSITDLKTFSSLTTKDIENLYNTTQNYDSLMKETSNQLNELTSRINISSLVDTAFENIMVGAATTIGSNAGLYGTWKTLGVLKDVLGSIDVPGATVFGTGIASGLNILNIMQTGMVGLGLLGSVVGGIGSLLDGGPTDLDNWNFEEYTQRGEGITPLKSGIKQTTSYSAQIGVGNSSSSDAENAALTSGKDTAMESSGTTSEEMEASKEIPEKIYQAIGEDRGVPVIDLLQSINDVLFGISTTLGASSLLTADSIFSDSDKKDVIDQLYTITNETSTEEHSSSSSNILSTLKNLETSVSKDRVFHTAITGVLSSPSNVQRAMELSQSITSTAYSNNTKETSTEGSSNTSGKLKSEQSSLTGSADYVNNSENYLGLAEIITQAIVDALSRVSPTTTSVGNPYSGG